MHITVLIHSSEGVCYSGEPMDTCLTLWPLWMERNHSVTVTRFSCRKKSISNSQILIIFSDKNLNPETHVFSEGWSSFSAQDLTVQLFLQGCSHCQVQRCWAVEQEFGGGVASYRRLSASGWTLCIFQCCCALYTDKCLALTSHLQLDSNQSAVPGWDAPETHPPPSSHCHSLTGRRRAPKTLRTVGPKNICKPSFKTQNTLPPFSEKHLFYLIGECCFLFIFKFNHSWCICFNNKIWKKIFQTI